MALMPVTEALAAVLAGAEPLPSEMVALDAAHHRRLRCQCTQLTWRLADQSRSHPKAANKCYCPTGIECTITVIPSRHCRHLNQAQMLRHRMEIAVVVEQRLAVLDAPGANQ